MNVWKYQDNPYLKGLDIRITGADAALEIMKHNHDIDVISIWDIDYPINQFPILERDSVLLGRFDDVSNDTLSGYIAPKRYDVRPLVTAPLRSNKLLVHCAMGYSRSTAIALLRIADRLQSPGLAIAALREAIRITHEAGWRQDIAFRPNARIVQLGDEILGFEGELMAEWEKYWELPRNFHATS